MRNPLDICMQDEDDVEATTYVVANLLYMYGAVDWPDISVINRELGPDQTIRGQIALYLLEKQFKLQAIGTYDPRQLLVQGEEYARANMGPLSSEPVKPWISPLIQRIGRQTTQVLNAYQEAKDRVECSLREATPEDIVDAVVKKRTVLLPWGRDYAPVLAYGIVADHIKLWYPYWDQPSIQLCPYERFVRQWQSRFGVEIFWR